MKTKGNFHPDIDNFDTIPFRKPEILHLILMFAGIPEECRYLDRENDLILIWSLLENVSLLIYDLKVYQYSHGISLRIKNGNVNYYSIHV